MESIFEAQMLTYLRLTKLKLGLVINFGEQYVKNGIRRVVNGLKGIQIEAWRRDKRQTVACDNQWKNFSRGRIHNY